VDERLAAVATPTGIMVLSLVTGSGSPCQVLWTDLSGVHLIAYCGTSGVINGTRFTAVNLHLPDTSGTAYTDLLW